MRLRGRLFPEPPRRIPVHRALGVTLRTAHLMTFGALLGGHLFNVDSSRLFPFLLATISTGAGLMALELASTCAWLFMGKGLAVLLKLLLLLMVPVFWEHRVLLLLAVVAVASVGSHMPSSLRHRCYLPVAWRLPGALLEATSAAHSPRTPSDAGAQPRLSREESAPRESPPVQNLSRIV